MAVTSQEGLGQAVGEVSPDPVEDRARRLQEFAQQGARDLGAAVAENAMRIVESTATTPVDEEFARHPNPFRAMDGPHPDWLGFGRDGQPK